jgi:quercetin 2,3-dioxygenase
MIRIRSAEARGRTDWDWLDSRHTFSFGEYHDPAHMGFRALRVITLGRSLLIRWMSGSRA